MYVFGSKICNNCYAFWLGENRGGSIGVVVDPGYSENWGRQKIVITCGNVLKMGFENDSAVYFVLGWGIQNLGFPVGLPRRLV